MPDFTKRLIDIYHKIPITSLDGLSASDFCILCIILQCCEVQESPGRKPDWQIVKSLFSIKWGSSLMFEMTLLL